MNDPTPQNDIEAEIRRQMLAERTNALAPQTPATHGAFTPYPTGTPRASASAAFTGAAPNRGRSTSPTNLLLTLGSMALSVVAYARLGNFSWPMAVGIVALIFVHESGHALAVWLRGKELRSMMFVPLFGAYVTHTAGTSLLENAFISFMGPFIGGIGGLAAIGLYFATGKRYMLSLALLSLALNLVNLVPVPPLDGSKVFRVFSANTDSNPNQDSAPAERQRFGWACTGLVLMLALGALTAYQLLKLTRGPFFGG